MARVIEHANPPPHRLLRAAATAACLALPIGARTAPAAPQQLDPFTGHSEQGHPMTGNTAPAPHVDQPFSIELLVEQLGTIQTIAGPDVNDFDDELYVVVRDQSAVVKVDAAGQVTPFADLGAVSPGAQPWSPALDVLGTYSGALFVNDAAGDQRYEIAPDGTAMISAFVNPFGGPIVSLACDPYGAFGAQLLLTDQTGTLHAVDPEGEVTLLATGLGSRDHGMAFGPGGPLGDALYIADPETGRVLRIPPSHEPGTPAPVWADLSTAGRGGLEPIGIAISAAGPFGDGVVYVADAIGRRIVALAADGTVLGNFVTGLFGPASIELPQTGLFAGDMVIAVGGAIWIVHPPQQPSPLELNGDGVVDARDLFALLRSWGACPPSKQGGCPADLTGDDRVDGADLARFLEGWR